MMEDVHVKLIQDCHGKKCIKQEEDSFCQQIGLKFEEETNKMVVNFNNIQSIQEAPT